MSKKRERAIPKKLLPAITGGTDCKVQFLDVRITGAAITSLRCFMGNNPGVDVLAVQFTRLFRVDDQLNEYDEVVLSDDDFFYFSYEFEVKPSEGNLYSQLLMAAFHGKEMPVSDFNPDMLVSNWVRLVIEDGRFLADVHPLTDTSAIDKVQ